MIAVVESSSFFIADDDITRYNNYGFYRKK
jgi:hypothetical protein